MVLENDIRGWIMSVVSGIGRSRSSTKINYQVTGLNAS